MLIGGGRLRKGEPDVDGRTSSSDARALLGELNETFRGKRGWKNFFREESDVDGLFVSSSDFRGELFGVVF